MTSCMTHSAPEPVFAEPWHAQLFAVTVALNESGRFAWPDWAGRFSETLKRNGLKKDLDGGDDYFHAWLETLEGLLAEKGEATPEDVLRLQSAWEDAYLATPHGHPVRLAET
ncbi:nitrile hydratase accessory protein [Rhodobacteraceae bacterium B1Z28]|uniref:Nitrile hydratase accessory protein n=1 Tax=Ruegeria haliotis TaxID=2747601 RepID=A0ABX2PM06_9RHOB|nr:nitrile hydratase accessory protein [Ruegeria haliotis]NVO54815.1 nitrile hydratase accessory protein [Ruegeria haliotis]